MAKINGAITFSVELGTNVKEDTLGKGLTAWLQANPFMTIEAREVVQSDTYISVVIFYSGQPGGKAPL